MKLSKLLLVEDNREAAYLAISILEYAQHIVVHKMTGAEAIEAVKTEYFDGVLLDYMLPDMDGLDVCRAIRQTHRELPVILTTAFVGKITEDTMAEAGITAFIPKPLSQNIFTTINKYIRTRSMEKAELKEPENLVELLLGPLYAE